MEVFEGETSRRYQDPRFSFFRSRHDRAMSSSSSFSDPTFSEDTTTEDSDDSSSESDSIEGSPSHDFNFNRHTQGANSCDSTSVANEGHSPITHLLGSRNGSSSGIVPPPPPPRRLHISLASNIQKARRCLRTSHPNSILCRGNDNNNIETEQSEQSSPDSYQALSICIKSISSCLPKNLSSLGIFLPILDRLARDIEKEVQDTSKDKEYRKRIGKEDAKALIALRQRWSNFTQKDVKGKGREGQEIWVKDVQEIVSRIRMPQCMSGQLDNSTSVLLTAFESLLFPSSLPRITLSSLHLCSEYLEVWDTLRQAENVLAWYLSFENMEVLKEGEIGTEATYRARRLLRNVTSLNLSRNHLTTLPMYLPNLFPSLVSLNVSHNDFQHLPPLICLWSHLRLIKTRGNHLMRSERRRGRALGTKWNDKFVGEIVLDRIRKNYIASGFRKVWEDSRERGKLSSLLEICVNMTSDEQSSLFMQRTRRLNEQRGNPMTQEEEEEEQFKLEADEETRNEENNGVYLLPKHLQDLVNGCYTCCSCRNFILPTSKRHLPPLFESVYHLHPPVSIPAYLPQQRPTAVFLTRDAINRSATSSLLLANELEGREEAPMDEVNASMMTTTTRTNSTVHRTPDERVSRPIDNQSSNVASEVPAGVGSNLAVGVRTSPGRARTFGRFDLGSEFGASPGEVSRDNAGARVTLQVREGRGRESEAQAPHRLSLDDKLFLAVLSRGVDLMTFVTGDEVHYRFCLECAVGHLRLDINSGLSDPEKEGMVEQCHCIVCKEEIRVRSEDPNRFQWSCEERPSALRWLRKRRAGQKKQLDWDRSCNNFVSG